jgi:hypothetical protein
VSNEIPVWAKKFTDCAGSTSFFRSFNLFKRKTRKEEYYFCIDASDTGNIRSEILPYVKFYFKINYEHENQVGHDGSLEKSQGKIIAALPFFPIRLPCRPSIYLPLMIPGKIWLKRDIVKMRTGELKQYLFSLTLDDFIKYRIEPNVYDVFFVMTFNHQEHHQSMNEFRYEIMREIQSAHQCNSVVGFVSKRPIPDKFAKLRIPRFNYRGYVQQMAKAKIGIYVRGNYQCISVKFGHLLSMAKPIAGHTLGFNQQILYENPYFDEQFAHEDPIQIASGALRLLRAPDQMKKLSESNADIFDKKFSPKLVAADMLLKMIK